MVLLAGRSHGGNFRGWASKHSGVMAVNACYEVLLCKHIYETCICSGRREGTLMQIFNPVIKTVSSDFRPNCDFGVPSHLEII